MLKYNYVMVSNLKKKTSLLHVIICSELAQVIYVSRFRTSIKET